MACGERFISFILIAFLTSATARDDFIINGRNAYRGECPWMAALFRNGGFLCGGCLISRRHVLTARHCVDGGAYAHEFYVMLGDHNIYYYDYGEQRVSVSQIQLHTSMDQAVLTLSSDANTASSYISIAPINCARSLPVGTPGKVCGWGQFLANGYGHPSAILQTTNMQIHYRATCYQYDRITVGRQELCVGDPNGKYHGTCFGDSGSPWLASGKVTGVVSKGIDMCPEEAHFAVFSSVPSACDWIKAAAGMSSVPALAPAPAPVPAPTPSSESTPLCNQWSRYYSTSSPSRSTGEIELLRNIYPLPCDGKRPKRLQAIKMACTSDFCRERKVFYISRSSGLYCFPGDYPAYCQCCDFAIRFKCPC